MEILKNKFLVVGGIIAVVAVILWSLATAVLPQPFKIAFLMSGKAIPF